MPTHAPSFDHIAIGLLIPSPTNPRKHFDNDKGWPEFVDSIVQHGVMQPILVRPWPADREGGTADCYEIVAGERRYRGSRDAQLPEVPCMIRHLTDREVLELQMIENLQRRDITELEEADGYRLMIDSHGYTADQLADKIGKSRSYIYGRLKLCDLTGDARRLVEGGSLDASTALLVARMPAPLQAKALEEVMKTEWNGERMSYRRARAHLHTRYTLDMASAPFPLDAFDLAIEPCDTCPKRTTNNLALFGDIDADVCTDPDCFAQKKVVWFEREAKRAEEEGKTVLRGKEGKQVIADTDRTQSGHVSLDASCWAAPRGDDENPPTYRELLEKAGVAVTTVTVLHEGGLQEVAPRTALREAMIQAGMEKAAPYALITDAQKEASTAALHAQQKANKIAHALDERLRASLRTAIAASLDAGEPLQLDDLRMIVLALWNNLSSYGGELIAQHWAPDDIKNNADADPCEWLSTHIETASAADLTTLLYEIAIECIDQVKLDQPSPLFECAKRYGVDPGQLRDQVEDELFPPPAHTYAKGDRVKVKEGLKGPGGKLRKYCGREGTIDSITEQGLLSVSFGKNDFVMLSPTEVDSLPSTAEPAAQAQVTTPPEAGTPGNPNGITPQAWPFGDAQAAPAPKTKSAKGKKQLAATAASDDKAPNSSGSAAGGTKRPGAAPVAYRDPDDPAHTWSGRGKKPTWVETALKAGKTLDDLKVPERCEKTIDMLEGA